MTEAAVSPGKPWGASFFTEFEKGPDPDRVVRHKARIALATFVKSDDALRAFVPMLGLMPEDDDKFGLDT